MRPILSFIEKKSPGLPCRRLAWPLAAALLCAACGRSEPANLSAPTEPATRCDLNRGPCTAPTRWGTMTLELSPRPLPVLKTIAIEARFDSANETGIKASLEGVEMDMGPNLVALERRDAQRLGGQLTIPVCLTGTMKWRLALQIEDQRQQQAIDFVFEAPLPSPAVKPAG